MYDAVSPAISRVLTVTFCHADEHVNIGFGEHKSKLGDKLPFGQLPLYEEGDFSLGQSGTIVRYVAKKLGTKQAILQLADLIDGCSGLYPSDAQAAATAESISDQSYGTRRAALP